MSIYFMLIIASGLVDVVANLLLKKSNGFENKIFGFCAVALVIVAFIMLSFTLEHIPLSIAYSFWGAVGVLGTCIGGWILYKEKLNYIGIIGIIIVIFSIFLLKN